MLKTWQRLLKADGTDGSTPPADPPATPPADQKGAMPEPDDDKGAGGKEALKKDVAKERDRRQAAEKELKEVKEKLVEIEQGKDNLTKAVLKALGKDDDGDDDPVAALEESKKRVALTEGRAKSALIKASVMNVAAGLGAHDAETVFAVANAAGLFADIPVDLEKGTVADVKPLILKLIEEKPFLVKAKGDTTGGGSPPGTDPDPGKVDRDEVLKMVEAARKGDPAAQLLMSKMENIKKVREVQGK